MENPLWTYDCHLHKLYMPGYSLRKDLAINFLTNIMGACECGGYCECRHGNVNIYYCSNNSCSAAQDEVGFCNKCHETCPHCGSNVYDKYYDWLLRSKYNWEKRRAFTFIYKILNSRLAVYMGPRCGPIRAQPYRCIRTIESPSVHKICFQGCTEWHLLSP